MPPRIEQHGSDVLLWIKAVPGSSRSQISGFLGERLKIRIAAPPEDGKANAAICELLAEALAVKPRDVSIHSGQTHQEKVIRIAFATADDVRKCLEVK
jgi:uncharacterized protein (TIGR00251 family)